MPTSISANNNIVASTTINIEEAVVLNTSVFTLVFEPSASLTPPTPEELWEIAEAIRDSAYMANRSENALTINAIYMTTVAPVGEPV